MFPPFIIHPSPCNPNPGGKVKPICMYIGYGCQEFHGGCLATGTETFRVYTDPKNPILYEWLDGHGNVIAEIRRKN